MLEKLDVLLDIGPSKAPTGNHSAQVSSAETLNS